MTHRNITLKKGYDACESWIRRASQSRSLATNKAHRITMTNIVSLVHPFDTVVTVHRHSEASERHRGVQEQPMTARRRVDTNVASDRHMLLHGNNILGHIMFQNSLRLRQMMMVQYVQIKNVKKKTLQYSCRRRPRRASSHFSSCQSIAHRSFASFFTLPYVFFLQRMSRQFPIVNTCRNKSQKELEKKPKYCVIFGACSLAAKSATHSEVTRMRGRVRRTVVYKVLALCS